MKLAFELGNCIGFDSVEKNILEISDIKFFDMSLYVWFNDLLYETKNMSTIFFW
jgi:hypothetical protein